MLLAWNCIAWHGLAWHGMACGLVQHMPLAWHDGVTALQHAPHASADRAGGAKEIKQAPHLLRPLVALRLS